MLSRFTLALLVLSSAARGLGAQATTGRLEGRVIDSVHARPSDGTSVFAIRAAPPDHSDGAKPDERGRYRIDSLPAGRYVVELTSPFLDSLELALRPREVTIEAGRTAHLDFAIPSGKTLRAAACPGLILPAGTGAVVGRVVDAESGAPIPDAHVTVAWRELSFDRTTIQATSAERRGEVRTDSLGRYRMCGVPTGQWLALQLQHLDRAGSEVPLVVSDSVGFVVRHLSLSVTGSRPLVAENASPSDTTTPPPLTGTASLTGVVRGPGGIAVAEARLRVLGTNGVAVSDTAGRYTLTDLPSGTQILEVKRIGYLLLQLPVELRGGRTSSQDLQLRRIVTLDSMKVLARRTLYRDFERNRKTNAFGRFLSEEDIERRHATEAGDLVRGVPGFYVSGYGYDARVKSLRGAALGGCSANIVIEGMEYQDINLLSPSSIGAMEFYREGEPGPVEYHNPCGLIVIWLRRG